jgi:transposase-like protein
MVMARKKEKKEKDILDQILDTIDFRGLTQDEVAGKDGIKKQLTGRILQRALDAEMTEHLGYKKNYNGGDNSNLRFARGQPERAHMENSTA